MSSPRTSLLCLVLLGAMAGQALAERPRGSSERGPGYERRHDEGKRERDRDRFRDRGHEERGRRISLDDAVQMVQRRYNARVVRAETHSDGARVLYRLRLLNQDGRVWTVTVDAASGAMY